MSNDQNIPEENVPVNEPVLQAESVDQLPTSNIPPQTETIEVHHHPHAHHSKNGKIICLNF